MKPKGVNFARPGVVSFMLMLVALLFTQPVWGRQAGTLARLSAKFDNYRSKNYPEKIFVHHDKNYYVVGELLWFKLYLTNGVTHIPSMLSKIAYVDIVNNENNAVLNAKIGMHLGSGHGSFFIPLSLSSGMYKIRAYTSWMMNTPEAVYEDMITIVNPSRVQDSLKAGLNSAAELVFFPEGGNLVRGLESRIAFKATAKNGKGTSFRGTIINGRNETITAFQPGKFGLGSFLLTPTEPGYRVRAVFDDGTILIRDLPHFFESGYVMRAGEESQGRMRVNVTTTAETPDSVHLIIQNKQSVGFRQSAALKSRAASFEVSTANLGEGANILTLFNSQGMAVSERIIIKPPPNETPVVLQQLSETTGTRQPVHIGITAGEKKEADLSVAVYRVDSLDSGHYQDIRQYTWLTSELSGRIESPEYYLQEHIPSADLELLALTHGWRRFRWEDIEAAAKEKNFLPEYNKHIVHGKVVDTRTNQSAAQKIAYLSLTGKPGGLYISESDGNGNVLFHTREFYGSNELITQTNSSSDSSYRVEIMDPFSKLFTKGAYPAGNFAPSNSTQLLSRYVNAQVRNAYNGDISQRLYAPVADSSSFFGEPARSYLLDNYTRFTSMEEVLREFVLEVGISGKRNDYSLKVSNGSAKGFYVGEPLMLIDGVPFFDPESILRYDPLKIRSISAMTKKYIAGPARFDGVVNFSTYSDKLEAFKLPPNALAVDYQGLQLKREFYSPAYATEEQLNNTLPDFRDLLYWSPQVKLLNGKGELNFYTSDQTGAYRVVLQGVTADGKLVSQTSAFTVTGK